MKYEVILLDADGTLFDYDKAEANALEKTFNHFNLKYREECELKNYRALNKQIWIAYENDEISLEDLRIERFRKLFQNNGEKSIYMNLVKYIFPYLQEEFI